MIPRILLLTGGCAPKHLCGCETRERYKLPKPPARPPAHRMETTWPTSTVPPAS